MDNFIVPSGTKEIPDNAFASRKDLVGVRIPRSVVRFGTGAFYNCTNLRSMTFEEGSILRVIGDLVFQNGKSLESINLPDTVELIQCHSFWHCVKLPGKMILPKNLKHIDSTAFFNTRIKHVVLPEQCEYQELDHGFPFSPSFPENCTVTGGKPRNFYEHFNLPLPRINYDKTQPDETLSEVKSRLDEYVVPPGTKEILNSQFAERKDLKHIVIPKSVVRVGASAFYFCENLESVVFEKGSKMPCIDYFVFQNCYNLKNIVLPDGLKQIRAHSFWCCGKLEPIEFPENVEYIDASAFFMTNIKNVHLPLKCKYQEKDHCFPWEAAFPEDCRITGGIPSDFYAERALPVPSNQDIKAVGKNPKGLKHIQDSKYVVPQGTKVIGNNQFMNRQDLVDIVIPKSVEVVGGGAFYLCKNLKSVVFEKGSPVKQITRNVFQNCESLEEVILPDGVEQFRGHSFWATPKLTKIDIPGSVKIIDCASFTTSNLREVTLPQDCQYQSVRHVSPLEQAFPKECIVRGGIGRDLYEENNKLKLKT